MFLRLVCIAIMIVFSNVAVHADVDLNTGFTSLEEFVSGLNDMPQEQFAKKGSLTPPGKISVWHQELQNTDPANFKAWNKKLRGLPTIGFLKNERLWELHPQSLVPKEVGYVMHKPYKPFKSEKELLKSLANDPIDVFQARSKISSSEDLMKWVALLQKENPDVLHEIVNRIMVLRKIGYSNVEQFHFPKDLAIGTQNPVGYVSKSTDTVALEMVNAKDLIEVFQNESPEELQKQFYALPKFKQKALLGSLEKKNPKMHAKVLAQLKSRTAIGFHSPDEAPELIKNPSQNPKARNSPQTKIGYTIGGTEPKLCDINSVLELVVPKK